LPAASSWRRNGTAIVIWLNGMIALATGVLIAIDYFG
jgi:hypothetical protein